MWECQKCGCKGIAAGLVACPMCEKEREMPKSTTGGASNAWEETEAAEVVAAEPAAEDAPVEAAPVPEDTTTVKRAARKAAAPAVEAPVVPDSAPVQASSEEPAAGGFLVPEGGVQS